MFICTLRAEYWGVQSGIKADMIGGRDRSSRGRSAIPVNHACEIRTVDGIGNGAPELARAKPLLAVRRKRGTRNLVEPHLLAFERASGIARGSRLFSRKTLERLGVDAVDQLYFTAKKADQFHFPVLLNEQPNEIYIGKPPPVPVLLPIIRIARENKI